MPIGCGQPEPVIDSSLSREIVAAHLATLVAWMSAFGVGTLMGVIGVNHLMVTTKTASTTERHPTLLALERPFVPQQKDGHLWRGGQTDGRLRRAR